MKIYFKAKILLSFSATLFLIQSATALQAPQESAQFTLNIPLRLALAETINGAAYDVKILCEVRNYVEASNITVLGTSSTVVRIDPNTGQNLDATAVVHVNVDAGKDPRQVNNYKCYLKINNGLPKTYSRNQFVAGSEYFDSNLQYNFLVGGQISQP